MISPDIHVSAIKDPLRIGGKWFREGDEPVILKSVTFGPFPAGAFPDEGIGQLARIRGELGANAVVGVRYDATEIGAGITEVLCYGTAVFVERSA